MKSYIVTKEDQCVGCNKCIFYCPVIDANVSYLDGNHQSKTRVRQDKCIMCGRCLEVCDHQARDYSDDTENFFLSLRTGQPISLLAAPSIKNNIPNYRRLFGYLRSLGVVNFYDVSFGADITTWAYLEVMEQQNISHMIAQPCPAIVSYIQYYCHSLLNDLAPVQSPLLCMAIYLKKYLQIQEKLSFLSPCVAKVAEINDPNTYGLVHHNITFNKLLAYLKEHQIDLDAYPEVDFSLFAEGLGEIYSLPGGLKENAFFYQPHLWVKQVEGSGAAYAYLKEYASRKDMDKPLPQLVDVLNCIYGCNGGSGTCKNIDLTDLESVSHQLKVQRLKNTAKPSAEALRQSFCSKLDVRDFLRKYTAIDTPPFIEPSREELEAVFLSMRKTTPESREVNCYSCGYANCTLMATAIYNGCNHKDNCVDYNHKMSAERDLLELKSKELEESNRRLQSLDEMKSTFLSTVSHELRTPLTSVLGFAKLIEKRLEQSIFPQLQTDDRKVVRAKQQIQDNIKIIISEGERLTNLINDVLDLSKMEAGKIEWHLEQNDVVAIVEQSIAAVRALYEEKQIALVRDIAQALPPVYCDRDRIIQVIINLLSNAVKFTNQGSVTCQVTSNAQEVTISIIDQGIGIAAEDLNTVFDKFKQVGDTLTDKPTGTGLGLSICKQIVEHHGGRIWATSQLGQGSTFSFILPLQKPLEAADTSNAVLTAASLDDSISHEATSGKTILVVDDEPHIQRLLRQVLEEKGYHVLIAEDGLQALALAELKPDLVLLDIMMPKINGFDVAAVLKNNPETKTIPIIIVSIVEDRERGLQVGVEGYFTKPIDFPELLQFIEQFFSKTG